MKNSAIIPTCKGVRERENTATKVYAGGCKIPVISLLQTTHIRVVSVTLWPS